MWGMGLKFRKGFTLMEALIVIAVLGVLLSITIAAFSRYLAESRLTSDTRRVAQAIMVARMKAVSTNMDYTFHMDAAVSPNAFQITGTNDTNGNSTLDPWEDVNGNGAIVTDTVYASAQKLDPPLIDHQGLSTFPLGLTSSQVMNTGTTMDLVFNGHGVTKGGAPAIHCIVLQYNGNSQAITFDETGRVRMFKYIGGWKELVQ